MRRTAPTLRIVTIAEWRTCHIDGAALSPEDRRLAEALSSSGPAAGRLEIDELRTGVRITARSWVGVVRFSTFELRVVPKLAGGDLGLVRLIDYTSGLSAMERHPSPHLIDAKGASLFDLVALLLAEACQRLISSGLLAEYREREDDLPVLRGRLLAREQVLRRYGRIDRLVCRYDEHTTDVPENQLLLAALAACARKCRHHSAASAVRRALPVFEESCQLHDLDLRRYRRSLTYDRRNARYQRAHALAWLVLDGVGVDDLYGGAHHHAFAFLLDMNRLFEEFIGRWLTDLLTGTDCRVTPQRRDRTVLWDADQGRPYASVIPDFLVQRGPPAHTRIPVDAKYKLYDERGLAQSDIYQCFLYAMAYGPTSADVPPGDGKPATPGVILLYPATSAEGHGTRLHVRNVRGTVCAELRAVGVHIPTMLQGLASGELSAMRETLMNMFQ